MGKNSAKVERKTRQLTNSDSYSIYFFWFKSIWVLLVSFFPTIFSNYVSSSLDPLGICWLTLSKLQFVFNLSFWQLWVIIDDLCVYTVVGRVHVFMLTYLEFIQLCSRIDLAGDQPPLRSTRSIAHMRQQIKTGQRQTHYRRHLPIVSSWWTHIPDESVIEGRDVVFGQGLQCPSFNHRPVLMVHHKGRNR